jgi:hypothetical protein
MEALAKKGIYALLIARYQRVINTLILDAIFRLDLFDIVSPPSKLLKDRKDYSLFRRSLIIGHKGWNLS